MTDIEKEKAAYIHVVIENNKTIEAFSVVIDTYIRMIEIANELDYKKAKGYIELAKQLTETQSNFIEVTKYFLSKT